MANNTYKNNTTAFDAIQKFINDNIMIADEMADIESMEIWQGKQKDLAAWIEGDGLLQDPLADEDWKAAKVERPLPFKESAGIEIETTDTENDLFEKNVTRQIVEYKAALEKDEDPAVLSIEKFTEDAIRRVKLNKDLEMDLVKLAEAAQHKRKQVTRQMIEKAATLGKVEARQLLEKARKEWNPGDKELEEIIQRQLDKLPQDVNSDTIEFKLADIKRHEDQERFSGALYFLESLRYSYPYTNDQIQIIDNERVWYDTKRVRDGERTSIHMIGDLRQKYIELKKVELSPEPTYKHNGKEINYAQMHQICLQVWQDASKVLTQKEILKANKLKDSSPNSARTSLNRLLTETKSHSFDGKVNEEIEVFPLTLDHRKLIQAEIDDLQELCDRENKAKELWNEGTEAKDAFIKLERFLSARDYFLLPRIDHDIYGQLIPAARSRKASLESSIQSIENRLKNAKLQNEALFKSELDEILVQTQELISKTSFWPHDGEKIINEQGTAAIEFTIEFPNEIKELQSKAQELQIKVNEYEAALELFAKERKEIQEGIEEKETRDAAISRWTALSKNPILSEFRVFTDFRTSMNNQTTIKVKLDIIRENIQEKKWVTAVTNIHELQVTEEFRNSDAATKNEVQDLLSESEIGFHKAEFSHAYTEKNYLGARYELTWLKTHGVAEDQFIGENQLLTTIEQEGAELDAFYKKALSESGINNEILTRVFSSRQRYIQRYYENPDTQTGDILLIRKIIDEKTREINLEVYLQELSKVFDHLAFPNKCKLLKKLHFIADGTLDNDYEKDYPKFSQSMAAFDADKIYQALSNMLRSSIIDFITGLKISDVRSENLSTVKEKFDAYHDFNFMIEEKVYQLILEKEFQITRLVVKNENLAERKKLWTKIHDRFPKDQRINSEWKSVIKESYIDQIERLIINHQFLKADELIRTAMNDDTVGACSEMYQMQIRVSTETASAENLSTKVAREALEKVKQWGASADVIKELSTRIAIAEIYEIKSEDTFGNMILLGKLFLDQNLDQGIIGKRFKEEYDPYTKGIETDIQRLNRGNLNEKREAIHLLLIVHQLDKEYARFFGESNPHVNKYISDMAPLLFADGIRLMNDANAEIIKSRRPSVTQSLNASILSTALLSTQLDSFVKFITEMADPRGENSKLSTLVEKVITLHVPENQRKIKLEDLRTQVNDADSDPKLSEFNGKKRDLDSETTALKSLQELLKAAVQVNLWEVGAENRLFVNDPTAWQQLAQQVNTIRSANRMFSEVILLSSSCQSWDTILTETLEIFSDLEESLKTEDFDQAEKYRRSFIAVIETLPRFDDDSQKPDEVKKYLKESISIFDDYLGKTIRSLGSIEETINEKKKNLQIWEGKLNEISADWDLITGKTSLFITKFEEFKKILTDKEAETLHNYKLDAEELKALTTEKSMPKKIILPEGLTIDEKVNELTPFQQNSMSKVKNIFNQANKVENEVSIKKISRFLNKSDAMIDAQDWIADETYPLAYDLEENIVRHDNYLRIKYQLAYYSSILKNCVSQSDKYYAFRENITILSESADKKEKEFLGFQNKLQNVIKLYQKCQKASINLLESNALKDQQWFETAYKNKQWNKLVSEIYEKDIYATRIYIERYRLNLLTAIFKKG